MEKTPIQSIKSKPQDLKGIFTLLEHYWEMAERLPAIEDHTIRTMDFYLSQKQKQYQSLPPSETNRHGGQLFEDCDFLGNQCRNSKMMRAAEHLRDLQERLMTMKKDPLS